MNPIRVNLSAAKRSEALTVTNSGSDPVVVQVSAMAWAQDAGKDVLSATSDVLVSPPIATIAPGKEQIVRVGLRRAPDAHTELSYRLFLQEVPPPPKPGFQGLQVALRVGLPIFVEPRDGRAKAALEWTASSLGKDSIRLTLQNQGNGHIQISDIGLYAKGGKDPIASRTGLVYVLPGQSHEWDLALRHGDIGGTERLRLKVTTDAGSIDTEIGLAKP